MATEGTEETECAEALSAAQRARIERNRLRARTLKEARLVTRRPINSSEEVREISVGKMRALDTGGGFLVEEETAAVVPTPLTARPAPLVHPTQQPQCLECERLFPQSYLFDTFDYSVCDDCRDDNEAHSLVTRTEAKSEFLLKDCDLDSRPPPLRCVRRRNPHKARFAEMRLYLRAQVEERARLVWGSEQRLLEERAAREERRERALATASRRRLTALRMAVRSSLYDGTHVQHEHTFGEEIYNADNDEYSRTCTECGHMQTYEKM
ncbi:DNA repair protein complementing XP-A cells homolog [Battus philenor]|uniref:DNA repair protein complementing XP-A cells homolog n=1 Tax=Battus philenor TaxID=42288 RepID=UPI0035CF49E6